MSVCLCVCVFPIEIQMGGRIRMKFGTEVVLEGGRFLGGGGVDPVPPPPGMGCLWSLNRAFGENFITQKLLFVPDLVRAGHLYGPQIQIRKDLGPMYLWSHGHSL